jgi:hypothetical protein
MYFNDETGSKNIDPVTGAHFDFKDMYRRLTKVRETREKYK